MLNHRGARRPNLSAERSSHHSCDVSGKILFVLLLGFAVESFTAVIHRHSRIFTRAWKLTGSSLSNS